MRYAIVFSLTILLLVGSVLAAESDSLEVSTRVPYLIAFLAGLISVLSPCGVPLLFGYLAVISKEESKFWLKTFSFFMGLLVVWIPLGFSASGLGNLIAGSGLILYQIAGALIILFGLAYLFDVSFPTINLSKKVNTSVIGMFGFGILFTLAWIPCVGPILGSILVLASTGSILDGGLLLLLYAVGFMMALIGIFIFLRKSGKKIHLNKGFTIRGRAISIYNLVGGSFLIVLGLFYVFNKLDLLIAVMLPISDLGYALEVYLVRNPAAAGLIALLVIIGALFLFRKKS